MVDQRRMRIAIDALLQNACDFSPDGGELKVSLEASKNLICLSISDPGVGISDKDRPHIFDRFYRGSPVQADGSVVDVRGMGQGLNIVRAVVDAHLGQIRLESQVGQGTAVTICIPSAVPTKG